MKLLVILLGALLVSTSLAQNNPCDGYHYYANQCSNPPQSFHDTIKKSTFYDGYCQVLVNTRGKTCADYCQVQGKICIAGQDNIGNGCELDPKHDRQDTEDNGCNQHWGNQICVCNDEPKPCDGYSDYTKKCQNTNNKFHQSIDTSIFTENSCQVLVNTGGKTCSNYCKNQGKICIAAQDNIGSDCGLDGNHEKQSTANNGCDQKWGNQVCVCDEIPEPANPCDEYTGYAKQCGNTADSFHKLINTEIFTENSCQVLVNTGGNTCNQYCETQGKFCLAAQDNVGSDCGLDGNHERQTTANNGCDQKWGNQVCVCDDQKPEPAPKNPCEGYDKFAKQCDNQDEKFHQSIDTSVFTENSCQVLVNTGGKTCSNYCETQGKTCIAAQDNLGSDCGLDGNHERQSTANNGCDQKWGNQVCVCDEKPEPVNPCEGYQGYAKQCENQSEKFHQSIDTSIFSENSCQVLVNTGGKTCSNYCKTQGKTCIAAQDNLGSGCGLDGNHERQSTANNGCDQKWGNQVCVCDEVDPCEGLTGYQNKCGNLPSQFHKFVNKDVFDDNVCQVLVNTSSQSCEYYCESQGRVCVAAQDNVGTGCALDSRHERQDISSNGCKQKWGNQVCVCK